MGFSILAFALRCRQTASMTGSTGSPPPAATNGRRPLFKYRALSGEFGLANAEDIILRNRMFWQSPTAFNDPFDCAPRTVFGITAADRKRWYAEAAKKYEPGWDRANRRSFVRKLGSSFSHKWEQMVTESFSNSMRTSAVTCFTLRDRHPLMWAHYGDAHSGICLEFQEDAENSFIALRVEYASERSVLDLTRFSTHPTESFNHAVLTKSKEWSYEEEYRMFEFERSAGFRSFPAHCLRSVTLGSRIKAADEEAIIGFVKQRKEQLPVYRSLVDERSFSFNLQRII